MAATCQTLLITIFIVFCVFEGCESVTSTGLPDGSSLYVCHDSPLNLNWNVSLSAGESINDIKWLYHGHGHDELMAIYTLGTFLPTPSYTARVQYESVAGIVMTSVTPSDSGNYSVQVSLAGQDQKEIYRAKVIVATDSAARQDATLTVTQESTAVKGADGEFHIELTCSSQGQQPPAVTWMTPDGNTVTVQREHGAFSLLVPNPVSEGNYTCKLPDDSPATTCLDSSDPVLTGTTIYLDNVEARLSLLEAENKDLRQTVKILEAALRTYQQTVGR